MKMIVTKDSSHSLVRNKGKLNLAGNRNKVLDTVIDVLHKQNVQKKKSDKQKKT